MKPSTLKRLREKAAAAAERLGSPSFYRVHATELSASAGLLSGNGLLSKCRDHLLRATLHPAHGLDHSERVALEAGAILRAECLRASACAEETEELMLCAQIAGLLHDIRRSEHNHTVSGSIEAGRILEEFEMSIRFKRYVTAAIRNHEAFKEVLASEDGPSKLVSDSLYDADKFRWGPDNFTRTLWLIVESTSTSAEELFRVFREKMEGIRRIKETFRTDTGKAYGPEFIDLGIAIGEEIYREMEIILER